MEKLNGYIAINERQKTSYINKGDSIDLTAYKFLIGEEFMVIDLSKVNDDAIRYVEKSSSEQIICPDDYTFELIGDYWQVKDSEGKIITQLKNSDCIKGCYFKYYGDDTFIAFEKEHIDGVYEEDNDDANLLAFETKFKLVNKNGEIISPPKEYYNMKPIMNTDTILCSYMSQCPYTRDGEIGVSEIINRQGKILFENLLVLQVFGPEEYQDVENYEELPLYYLDMTEDNIKKFEDSNWKDEDINIIDDEFLKTAEGMKNV